MNLGQSLKLHYLNYRLFYILFWILNFLTTGIAIFVFQNSEQLIYRLIIGAITASLIFSLLLGIYEYQLLLPRYLNLSNIKGDFFWGGLLFNFINSLLQAGHLVLLFALINSLMNFVFFTHYNKAIAFLLIVGLHFFIFAIVNLFTLILRKYILLIKILLIIAIGLFGYYLKDLLLFWENNMSKYLTDTNASFRLLLIILVGSVFTYFIIFLISYKEK